MRSNLHGWIHPCIPKRELNHSTVCIQSVYTFNSIAVKVCLTFFYFMSDEEVQSSPECAPARSHYRSEDDNPTSIPTADAFSLFSTGHWSSNCPEISGLTTPAVPNEVLSLIDFNLCLDTYEYDNELVQVYNVKGRLYYSLQFWKEKLLLAEFKKLVLPIE